MRRLSPRSHPRTKATGSKTTERREVAPGDRTLTLNQISAPLIADIRSAGMPAPTFISIAPPALPGSIVQSGLQTERLAQ